MFKKKLAVKKVERKKLGMSRTKNSLMNMTSSVVYQMINLVMSFISRTVFLQVLGVGYLGINGLFSDVLSMLNMAELGIGTAMTYSMYKPLAENDHDTLAGLINFYKKVYRIIACTIAVVGMLLVPFLPYLVNLDQNIPHVELYYLLFLASNVASYFVVAKTTVLYADQKNYVLIKYSAYWHIAEVISMLLVLWMTKNYTLYLITQVLFIYGQNFHKSHIASKYYPYIDKKVTLSKEKTKGIFKDVGSALIYKIANVLITATDNTLISVLISTEMVGYYSNYGIIIGKLNGIVGTMFTSSISSLGNLIVKERAEKRYHVYQIMNTVSQILCTFFVTCLILLVEDFINIWLGPEYILGKTTLFAAVLSFYLTIATAPVYTFREAAGLFRQTKYIMLITAVLNITFSIILGKVMGLAGILLATSLSKLLTFVWYEPMLLYRTFFNKHLRLFFSSMLSGVIITIISIMTAKLSTFWFVPTNWLEWIIKAVIVACVSLFVIVVSFHKTEGFILMLGKLKELLRVTSPKGER